MKRAVLDASVLIKLFFEEEHSGHAERCVRAAGELHAPDLIWAEAANVIWKRHRCGDLTRQDAAAIAMHMIGLPLHIHPAADLVPDALSFAMRFDRTVYDGLYVVLAIKTNSAMISGDRRLVNALSGTPIEQHAVWIGDYR